MLYGNDVQIKDLRIFQNIKLSDILIVDNNIYAFGLHLANGIPIKSWTKHDKDCSLY